MRLIPDWRRVVGISFSFWAAVLGLVALIIPEAIYATTGRDTDPYLLWWIGVGLSLAGILGRLVLQQGGALRNWLRIAGAVALILLLSLVAARAMGEPERAPPVPVMAEAGALPAPDAVFLATAVPFIGGWEGLRTTAYLDTLASPPVWTVCYGETRGVREGDSYTAAECAAMLAPRVLEFRRAFHRHVVQPVLSRLQLGPDVAFTSLAYNIGSGALATSTALRRLNAGDRPGACEALTWWNKAGQRVIRGLVARRSAERDLCLA